MNGIKRILGTLLLSCIAITGLAQPANGGDTIVVTGVVSSAATLQPVAFAQVSCGDFSSGFTNDDGTFSIKVRSLYDVITVHTTGYHVTDIILAGRQQVEILLPDLARRSFQQLTNTGHWDVKEAYSPRSQATANNLTARSVTGATSPETEFSGFAAGLLSRGRSGITGIGSDIFLRGFSSLNSSNQPLIVVDGMIYDISNFGNPLIKGNRINPLGGIDIGDIENVTVIRDAMPIFGAKAANGVILITTSRADQQATTINFQMHGGMHLEPQIYPLLNASQYKSYLGEMLLSSGMSAQETATLPYFATDPSQTGFFSMNNNTDWQRELFKQAYTSNYSLRIKGGDDVALYALGVGYLHQGGMVETADYSRFNLRFNSDIKFSELFTLNSNISFVYHNRNIGATGYDSPDDAVAQSRLKAPFMHPNVIDDDGLVSALLAGYDPMGVSNPMAILDNHIMRDQNYRFFGAFNFNLEINDNLTISNLAGLSFDKNRETMFIPSHGVQPVQTPLGIITNKMGARVVRHLALNNDLRALYKSRFGYAHGLQTATGVRMNINRNEEDWGRGFSSANDDLRTMSHGIGILRQKGGFAGAWNSVTVYTTIDYDFRHKYFLNVGASIDGSSRFGREADGIDIGGSVFGFFPSVAGAWLVTSEPFLADARFLDLFKIRASYGITGNDDIGNYSATSYFATNDFLSFKGVVLGNLYNPSLKWETNTKANLGLDFAMFNERVSGSVDIYRNVTTDMITFAPAPVISGFDFYIVNDGGLTTRGIDMALNSRILNGSVRWDAGIAIGTFTTRVESIRDGSKLTSLYGANMLTRVGNPLAVFYGHKTLGVYASQAEATSEGLLALLPNATLVPFAAGDIRFHDADDNGIIDNNDMQVIGDPTPDFHGEVNTSARWQRFTFDAAISFAVGGDVYNFRRRQLESMSGFQNQTAAVLNRWQFEGQQADLPRAVFGDPIGNSRFSDRWIEDGSYARLRSVSVVYDVPARPFGIQNLEVYATANNLVTFTRYKGLDPVFSAGVSPLLQGIDLGLLPRTTSFLLGVRVGL